ncbi:ubiquinol-cytochrome C chaperone family protein [Asticcacaulis solisilvae]|uniref:ubiquinol-cytochrome C chaperone family protein n=1 Tax=Asticcacaulis solisilvae TaxID=1217274 RepID=UPI003FD895BE
MPSPLEKLKRLFQPRPIRYTGHALYSSCVEQSRQPIFYKDYGIEDAIGARFELLTFHVGLVIHALKALPAGDARRAQAQETAQVLFDTFIDALDHTLREQGTGDLTVPKKMKKLGEVIYTRMKRWDDLWATGTDTDRADYAARTIFAGSAFDGDAEQGGDAPQSVPLNTAQPFATYADEARKALDVDAILNGRLDWCAIPDLDAESAGAA